MLTILFLMSLVGTAPALLNPAVGAIRWDAWLVVFSDAMYSCLIVSTYSFFYFS